MSGRRHTPAAPGCLRVVPRPRGGWVVLAADEVVIAEHSTVTEAEQAALAHLRAGDELIVYDCYHRCHRSALTPGRRSDRARRERIGH